MKKGMNEIVHQEKIIRNEPATWIKSDDLAEHGRLILTEKRLCFARNLINTSTVSRYFFNDQSLQVVMEIDLDTINQLSRGKHIVDDNVVQLTWLQYDDARFSVIDYDAWEKDIQKARMHPDIPGDPNQRSEEAA